MKKTLGVVLLLLLIALVVGVWVVAYPILFSPEKDKTVPDQCSVNGTGTVTATATAIATVNCCSSPTSCKKETKPVPVVKKPASKPAPKPVPSGNVLEKVEAKQLSIKIESLPPETVQWYFEQFRDLEEIHRRTMKRAVVSSDDFPRYREGGGNGGGGNGCPGGGPGPDPGGCPGGGPGPDPD